jgi:arsenite oxidase small subunit
MTEPKLNRRIFMMSTGGAVGAVGLAGSGAANAQKAAQHAATGMTLTYPKQVVGKASTLPLNQATAFMYPDSSSRCYAIRLGSSVPSGVGPNKDIVAYSGMCTHMGCPVAYVPETKSFKCGCHYSMFDAELDGQMIVGQATEDLPRVLLEFDDKTGAVHAVGIDGLLYGRQANIL